MAAIEQEGHRDAETRPREARGAERDNATPRDRTSSGWKLTGAWIVALWFGLFEVAVGIVVATRPSDTVFSSVEGALQLALVFSAPAIWLGLDRLLAWLPGGVARLMRLARSRLPSTFAWMSSTQRWGLAQREPRTRRREQRSGLKRALLGDQTAWMRLSSQRSLGDQFVDVGVRIAVPSAAFVLLFISASTSEGSAHGTGSWRPLLAFVVIVPVALVFLRWWISYVTGAITFAVVLALLPQIDLAGLQREWNQDQDYRIVEFVLVERSAYSVSTENPDLMAPAEALAKEPGAESIMVTCTSGDARALGATVRVAWSEGELADVKDQGVWVVREVVVLSSPQAATLQRRLDAYC